MTSSRRRKDRQLAEALDALPSIEAPFDVDTSLVPTGALTPAVRAALDALLASRTNTRLPASIMLLPNAGVVDDNDGDGGGALSGYAATYSTSACAADVLSPELGSGVSWVEIVDPTSTEFSREADLVAAFKPLPSLTLSPNARISIVKTTVSYPRRLYVVVEGNDRAAADALLERARACSAPLGALLPGGALASAYDALLVASHELRVRNADTFVRAARLEFASETSAGNAVSYSIAPVGELACIVYSGAFDPDAAEDGVFVYSGAIDSYTHMIGARRVRRGGVVEHSWSNDVLDAGNGARRSVFPADTGVALAGRRASRSRADSPLVAAAMDARVKWCGAVRSYNPRAARVYHAIGDPAFVASLARLGHAAALEQHAYETIIMQVPAIDSTTLASRSALASLAARVTEARVPVRTATLLACLAEWPGASTLELKTLFDDQRGDVTHVRTEHLRALTTTKKK